MATDGDANHCRRCLLELVREVGAMTVKDNGGELVFKKDCMDLIRRVSLLTHFVEEITDLEGQGCNLEDGSDLMVALQAAHSLLSVAAVFQLTSNSDGATEKIALEFEIVTKKLEQALSKIPYDQFDISEEVQEQVGLVRRQLRRATERYGSMMSFQSIDKEVNQVENGNTSNGSENIENSSISPEVAGSSDCCSGSNSSKEQNSDEASKKLKEGDNDVKDNVACKGVEDVKKTDAPKIPQDFLCPISLELMKDPVIVATGQTYERSYIQRWIDSGNVTCPKTQLKLENFTLTPNYVLRSLINQWCVDNNVEQPTVLANGRIKKSDGSFRDVSGDIETIQALVRKLSSQSIDERKYAVSEIRSLSKRSTDNRILIAEAGAIPILVNLLTSDDVSVQENAVTSILNLSIYESNKDLIMLAGAVPSIVQVLRAGGVEARENAAATLFSLSLADENKIIIGASGAIPALVDLLEHGTTRGKKDAATALFNLCIYQGNKGKAVRAGIITALSKMLTDSRNCMVDEALTILSVLASNQEAKVAIAKASTLPVLIDLLGTGMPRNKENAAAILLSLCKRDPENLACINRLGAVTPLTELSRNGTERAKRKATSLLEHIKKLQQH